MMELCSAFGLALLEDLCNFIVNFNLIGVVLLSLGAVERRLDERVQIGVRQNLGVVALHHTEVLAVDVAVVATERRVDNKVTEPELVHKGNSILATFGAELGDGV